MADPTQATCALCGDEVIAVSESALPAPTDLYPEGINAKNVRFFRQGSQAFLHHACTSPQAATEGSSDPPTAWWACQQPDRPIDDDVRFEIHCADCAERYGR